MTDDSLPDLEPGLEAASAHFDGVADVDERALVDGSEAVQQQVASFAELRTRLNDLPPVPQSDLDDTLAAALAEFDTLAAAPAAAFMAGSTAPGAPSRVDHPRWSRILTIAAAAVILGVVGVAIAKGVGGTSGTSSSAGKIQFDATTIAAAAGGAPAPTGAQAVAGLVTSTIGAINSSADALPRYDQEADLRTLPGAADTAQATADSGLPVVPAPTKGSLGVNGVPLTGPVVFPFTCPLSANQLFIAEISWRGTNAAAVRDTVTNVTQAIDPQCKVLVSVGP